MRLNQVIALVTGKKAAATKTLTEVHRSWQMDRLCGMEKTYQPLHEDGIQLPPESKKVQLRVKDEIKKLRRILTDFYGLVAAQEIANCDAKATVKCKGLTVENVPVGVLLFLEKQLVDLHTLTRRIPVLDVDKSWQYDANSGLHVTEPVVAIRRQKVQEPLILYQATKEHPAQTTMITKDVPTGKWTTTHLSGCMAADEKEAMIERIESLLDAVKKARAEANSNQISLTEATKIADSVLSFIFDK